jgi:hypothetical protein
MSDADDGQVRAQGLDAHRAVLRGRANDLAQQPWQIGGQPASDADLVRLAAWRAADPAVDPATVLAGLGLLDSARAELDQVEAALLFAARAAGLTFQQIAEAIGVRTQQAAQQRMARVLARSEQAP